MEIEEVDWSTGQILDALKELGIEKNTLVIFTTDNGGDNRSVNAPLRGGKHTIWEGGIGTTSSSWRCWFQPGYAELIRQASGGDVLYNDDTTIKILELMGKRAQQKALAEESVEGVAPEKQRSGLFTSGVVSTSDGRRIALFFSGATTPAKVVHACRKDTVLLQHPLVVLVHARGVAVIRRRAHPGALLAVGAATPGRHGDGAVLPTLWPLLLVLVLAAVLLVLCVRSALATRILSRVVRGLLAALFRVSRAFPALTLLWGQ